MGGNRRFGGYPPPMGGPIAMLAPIPAAELAGCQARAPIASAAEVIYDDRSWRPVTVLAWARYRGGWAVQISWPGGTRDWREYDHRHIRPVSGGQPGDAR